ncbi:nucleotidyltransferase family protein [Sporolactobacillus sp. CPB3-1]|uniref:Nucleotidyltransferase family protein n=1 Tax=Sporolactobacillus mangiferae TaxID=2940498 RepID=A0ABT0M9F4_9BACL|nr:nucleotidyltransferase family protein [Sporolactobacillus mangiferae]MCL1631494.1 nucleotidyltransferase family protein [Sporolactobacillus mangiferae]
MKVYLNLPERRRESVMKHAWLKSKKDLVTFIAGNQEIMTLLHIARAQNLPDCWICAGFLRTRIWDVQTGVVHSTPVHDVDLVYFDDRTIDYTFEQTVQARLRNQAPDYNWEVKNEARMHVHNPNTSPYLSSTDAIAKFPETVTSIGARLNAANRIELAAPHGVSDLLTLTVRPTPFTRVNKKRMDIYRNRILKKEWKKYWPDVNIVLD